MSGSHHDPPNWDLLRTQDRHGMWQKKETSKIRRTLESKKETKLLHKMAGLDSKNENDIFLLITFPVILSPSLNLLYLSLCREQSKEIPNRKMAYNAKQSRIDRVSPSSFLQAKESCSDWFKHKWSSLKRHWAVHRKATRPETVTLHQATVHNTQKSVSHAQKVPKAHI